MLNGVQVRVLFWAHTLKKDFRYDITRSTIANGLTYSKAVTDTPDDNALWKNTQEIGEVAELVDALL